MFEILIPLIAGLSLVMFVAWEKFFHRQPIDRKTLEAGFEPGLNGKVTALFALGATGIFFGLYLIANPQHPPFTGSGALISRFLYSISGPYGHPLLSFGLSALAITAGFSIKKNQQQARKKTNAG